MSDEENGNGRELVGITGMSGPMGPQGPPGYVEIEEKNHLGNIFVGLGLMFLGIAFIMSQTFSWLEVAALRHRVDQVSEARRREQAEEDCLFFYRNDVSNAIGEALAANNSLFISVARRPPILTDEQRVAAAEDNKILADALEASNTPLLDATKALRAYEQIDPPANECPHPAAARARERSRDQEDEFRVGD